MIRGGIADPTDNNNKAYNMPDGDLADLGLNGTEPGSRIHNTRMLVQDILGETLATFKLTSLSWDV